jgi:hypothetical protein
MNAEFLIPVAFFAMIYGIVYLLVRKKERQALLEKGADVSVFEVQGRSYGSLKWGLLLVGIGVGILLGKVLGSYTALEEEPAYFSMICLFGGIALIIFHMITGKLEKNPKL